MRPEQSITGDKRCQSATTKNAADTAKRIVATAATMNVSVRSVSAGKAALTNATPATPDGVVPGVVATVAKGAIAAKVVDTKASAAIPSSAADEAMSPSRRKAMPARAGAVGKAAMVRRAATTTVAIAATVVVVNATGLPKNATAGCPGRCPGAEKSNGADGGYDEVGDASGRHMQHDPDYHQWRSEQMRNLDNDYSEWRKERYKKFSEDFDQWRSSRAGRSMASGGQPSQGPGSSGASGGSTSVGSGSGTSGLGSGSSATGSGLGPSSGSSSGTSSGGSTRSGGSS